MNNSFTYGGVSAGNLGVTVVDFQRFPGSPPRIGAHSKGVRSGQVLGVASFAERPETVGCVIEAENETVLVENLDALKIALDPRNGVQLLVWDHETMLGASLSRGKYAVLDAPIIPAPLGPCAASFELVFRVPYPFDVTVDAFSQSGVAIDSDPKTIHEPSSADETVAGSSNARPVILLTNTDAATLNTVTITNETTGEAFTCTYPLIQNAILRIDTEREHAEVSTDAGSTYVTAMRYVTTAQEFPHLSPGVRNEFTIDGFVAGTFGISYRGEFM